MIQALQKKAADSVILKACSSCYKEARNHTKQKATGFATPVRSFT